MYVTYVILQFSIIIFINISSFEFHKEATTNVTVLVLPLQEACSCFQLKPGTCTLRSKKQQGKKLNAVTM